MSLASHEITYTLRDRLGSVVTLTGHNNHILEHRSYDPFGKPRYGTMLPNTAATLFDVAGGTAFTLRGFTDHEHIDEAQLIHMNGRVYDYNLGRFLSIDPFIQAPGNSQSLNPYSYIMNNPLAGTDPSGYALVQGSINCIESMAACAAVLNGGMPTKSDFTSAATTNGSAPTNDGSDSDVEAEEVLAPNTASQQSERTKPSLPAKSTSGGTKKSKRRPVFYSEHEHLKAAVDSLNSLSAQGQFDTVDHDFSEPVNLVYDPELESTPDPITGEVGYMEVRESAPNTIRISDTARDDLNAGLYKGLKIGHELIHIRDYSLGRVSRAQSEINAWQWEHDNIDQIFHWPVAKASNERTKRYYQQQIDSWMRRLNNNEK